MIFQIITFVYFKSLNNVHQFFAPMQELVFHSLSKSLKTRSCTQSTASNLIYPDTRNRVKRASTHPPLRNFAIQHHRASETISDTLFLFLHITFETFYNSAIFSKDVYHVADQNLFFLARPSQDVFLLPLIPQ